MLRGFKRQLMLLLALAGLGVGSAVAEPLTKYTVTYGNAPAVSATSATPVLKTLKLAAAPRAVHTITFNVTGDVPYVVKVTDMDSAEVTVALPVYYEYLGATVDGLDVVKDAEALWWDWIEVDVETLTFTFDQVVADHQVNIRCNPPKYVAMTGNDRNDGSLNRPFRTIQRGVNACNGVSGYVIVLPGVYEPFSCPNAPLHVIAQGPVGQCVIDGGGTNRCATMGSAYGENAAELVGFTLRNGRVSGEGGGALYGCVVRCSIIDCRAEGKGGGVSGAAVENTLIATCMAGGSGNLANASDLRNCTLRDSAETGVSILDSTVRNCVATCEGGAQLLKGVTVFSHSVTNVTYAYPLRPATGRLLAGSPGLGAGDVSLVAAGETDLDGNPRLTTRGFATTVNCGCYESAVGTCTVRGTIRGVNPWGTNELHVAVGGDIPMPFGFTVHWLSVNGKELPYLPIPGGPFISGVTEGMTFETYITAKRYADEKNGNDANDGFTPETAKKTLQAAIDIAPGATDDAADSAVFAAPGTYGPIATDNRRIEVLGTKGAGATVIDGGGTNRCADLGGDAGGQLINTVLRGFTVRNGRCGESGGGVRGGTVIACVISDNVVGDYGGGVAYSTVRESLITRNVNNYDGSAWGGACYLGNYFNCTIVGNSAPNGNGDRFVAGVYAAHELVNCVVQENYGKDGVERNTKAVDHMVATVTNGADFADAARGDWHLTRYSPGVGTGDLAYVKDETDLDGLSRTTTSNGVTTVNSGCYERTFPCLIHVTYTGFDPYGTNEFREVDGKGPLVPRGYAVTELTTNDVPVAKLPQIGEPLVTGVRARMEVVVHFSSVRFADAKKGSDAYDGLSPDKAKKTLQAAIDIASTAASNASDSVVFAAPGTYAPIATENRKISVVGTEGAARTIIDGGGKSRCADLSGYDMIGRPDYIRPLESTNTVLAGFTVCNGYTYEKLAGAGDGAGVRGGTVVACVISGNTVYQGSGGGCYDSVLRESLIVGNRIEGPTIIPDGAAALACLLYNCTVVSNTASMDKPEYRDMMSYGICGGWAFNCIVQDNRSASGVELNVRGSWMLSTVTNGAVFVDAANGDFHLKNGSAGVAAGNVAYVMDKTDLEGAARLTTNAERCVTVNCGCYETIAWAKIRLTYTGVDPYGTNEFAAVNGFGPEVPRGFAVTELAMNGVPVAKLPQVGEPLVSGVTTDTEVVVRFIATRYADAKNGDDANDGLSPDKAKRALQAAIDIAPNGRTAEDSVVFAAPGVYQPIATANRKLMILGAAGAGETVIDGGNTNRCADLGGKEFDGLTNTVLRGFSVLNGRCNKYGGGVRGGTVIACVIADNVADDFGGGVAYSTVRESLITRNVNNCDGTAWGGGCCYGNYFNCTIVGNSAPNGSGSGFSAGVFNADNLINCVVQGNYGKNGVEQNTRDIYHTVATVTNGAVFANAANGDYHLKPESPGVAAGDVAAVIDATDLEGAPRLTTNDTGGVTVNCGCYETLRRFRIHVTYTGVDPYGTNEFLDVEGNGPVVPRGYAVTELAVDGEPAAKLPAIGEPLVSGVMADTEVVARFAAQRYADAANGDDANDGLSPDKAKKTLQVAIDAAPEAVSNAADSVVFAAPGTYAPIVCLNRRLSVIGTGGPGQVAIDAAKYTSSRCATLRGSDSVGTNTVLSGFTLRNGNRNGSSDVVNGGGAYGGTLIGCVITNCCASQFGGGAACSALRNCLVARNRALTYSAQKPPGAGGYAVWCSNCTIADNAAPNTRTTYGLGLSVESGSMVVNSIVQGNTGLYGESGPLQVWSPPDMKSTIESGAVFVDAENGDYHLKPESAGIAAGDVASVRDATDLEGAARLTTNGLGQATVNCGCYETVEWAKVRLTYTGVDPYGVNEFAAVGRFGPLVPRGSAVTELMVDGVSAAKLPQVGEPLVSGVTADTEVVVRFTAQRYADAANGDDANDGCSPDKPKKTLQAAIDVAPAATSNAADSIVFAAPGTYAPIATANRMLTIVGTEGAAKTIIDGGDTSRCADLSGDGTYTSVPTHTNTVLMGFTVRKGRVKHETGAGVRGGTVVACVVSTNVAESNNGAGCAYSVVRESLITGNLMPRDYSNPFGAGTFNCRLYNCTVVSNSTGNRDFSFGGCCGISGGFAVNCIVQGNRNASGEERNVDDAIDLISTVTNGAKFVDAANGDYHLMSDGAGVAAGNVGYVMDATDLEGAARLTTNATGVVTVNCGCYETVKEAIRFVAVVDGGETYLIPYAWLETYGLAPSGSDYDAHYTSATNASANPVSPGATEVLPAWKSYVAGLDPTNALEMFYSVITAPSNGWFRVGPNEVRTGRAYTVRETGVLRGAAVTNLWPIAEGRDAVDVEDNGTNSFFKVNVRVK